MNALNIKANNRTATVQEFYSQLKNKDTARRWERVKKAEKPPVDFYTKKKFWFKTLIAAIVLLMIFSVVVIAIETISIKKAAETTNVPEVSTEEIPDEGDSFWDIFRSEDEPEQTTEDKIDEDIKPHKDNVTSEAAVNTD